MSKRDLRTTRFLKVIYFFVLLPKEGNDTSHDFLGLLACTREISMMQA